MCSRKVTFTELFYVVILEFLTLWFKPITIFPFYYLLFFSGNGLREFDAIHLRKLFEVSSTYSAPNVYTAIP